MIRKGDILVSVLGNEAKVLEVLGGIHSYQGLGEDKRWEGIGGVNKIYY